MLPKLQKITFLESQSINPRQGRYFVLRNRGGYFKFAKSEFGIKQAKNWLAKIHPIDKGALNDFEWLICLYYNNYPELVPNWRTAVVSALRSKNFKRESLSHVKDAVIHLSQNSKLEGNQILWLLLLPVLEGTSTLEFCVECENLFSNCHHKKLFCSRQCCLKHSQKTNWRYLKRNIT